MMKFWDGLSATASEPDSTLAGLAGAAINSFSICIMTLRLGS